MYTEQTISAPSPTPSTDDLLSWVDYTHPFPSLTRLRAFNTPEFSLVPIREAVVEAPPIVPMATDEKHMQTAVAVVDDSTALPAVTTTALVQEAPPSVETVAESPAHTDDRPLFEPYHAVDYFASQGIKLGLHRDDKDQLSKGMKSFTEWLKTMKRLPATEVPQSVDAVQDKVVTKLANRSVELEPVLTEAMAEVWLSQGRIDKAREVYQKLSLQQPRKSAYFAAKMAAIPLPSA